MFLKNNWLKTLAIMIVVVAGFSYLYLSLHLLTGMCPDEEMRLLIPQFIYKYNQLPLGDEEEVRHYIWGFSYGYVPYLVSLFGVLCMKLMSFVKTTEYALLVAVRQGSVLSGIGTVIITYFIGKELFEKKSSRILFMIFVGFLPQFAYLSGYLNNDSFSVFCVGLIMGLCQIFRHYLEGVLPS